MESIDTILPPVPWVEGFMAMVEDQIAPSRVQWVLDNGYLYGRPLAEGQWLCVAAMTYGKGRVVRCTETTVLDGW